MGWHHAGTWLSADGTLGTGDEAGGSFVEYGEVSDYMGQTLDLSCEVNAVHKYLAGWIPEERVTTLSYGDGGEYEIVPTSTDVEPTEVQIIKIELPSEYNVGEETSYLWVSYKTNCVLFNDLYTVQVHTYPSNLAPDDIHTVELLELRTGHTISGADPIWGSYTFTLVSTSSSSATVQITPPPSSTTSYTTSWVTTGSIGCSVAYTEELLSTDGSTYWQYQVVIQNVGGLPVTDLQFTSDNDADVILEYAIDYSSGTWSLPFYAYPFTTTAGFGYLISVSTPLTFTTSSITC
eukprot:TRINITY_DN4396_c0_g1_i5.p1 TRINITY_DN4396_c0_g1~~TRINITY_DN4396_c0_g1_i5.p1  ORF type:complete len:292 (-),score=67.62 TRINITY_DN4396_c0_g1_i5:182-1057(-)